MTRDEIMEMAKEAGFRTGQINLFAGEPLDFIAPVSATTCIVELERFAALVEAKEREACAAACDALQADTLAAQSGTADDLPNVMLRQVAHLGAGKCARAIRARSQQ